MYRSCFPEKQQFGQKLIDWYINTTIYAFQVAKKGINL